MGKRDFEKVNRKETFRTLGIKSDGRWSDEPDNGIARLLHEGALSRNERRSLRYILTGERDAT